MTRYPVVSQYWVLRTHFIRRTSLHQEGSFSLAVIDTVDILLQMLRDWFWLFKWQGQDLCLLTVRQSAIEAFWSVVLEIRDNGLPNLNLNVRKCRVRGRKTSMQDG